MKALAVAVLFVSFACLANGSNFAELVKAGVEVGRSGGLEALYATEEAVQDTGRNIVHEIIKSKELIHSTVQVCRKAVDGVVTCCCAAANRVTEFADDGVLRCRAAVARCTHAACTAIDGVLDGPVAAAARKVVEAGGSVADKGLDLAVASHEAVIGLGVRGLELAQKGAHLALKGVDGVADVGHFAAMFGVGVGAVGMNFVCWAGRSVADSVADEQILLINAIDSALGGRPQRPVWWHHPHQE